MPNSRQFWSIVVLIGIAHAVAVVGLVRWNSKNKAADPASVVWVSSDSASPVGPSGAYGQVPDKAASRSAPSESTPATSPAEHPEDEDSLLLASAKSQIELPVPTATPTPVAKPSPTPLFKGTPKPSPKPPRKPRPKPSPRPTPTPTPKPKPKTMVLAKASPRPAPEK